MIRFPSKFATHPRFGWLRWAPAFGAALALGAAARGQTQTENLTPYQFTTVAGQTKTAGSTDGTGSSALFSLPHGVAVDGKGNLYVADTSNQKIRMIAPGGVVTTIAGTGSPGGVNNSVGTLATFDQPTGIAVDSAGNLYVADTANYAIRKLTPSGSGGSITWAVSTFAGVIGSQGTADGAGLQARFDQPEGVAVDSAGNVYVADSPLESVRLVTPAGVVSTIGTGFSTPYGVAVDGSGNVYVASALNNVIYKMAAGGGTPAVLAGNSTLAAGYGDGTGTGARFNVPSGVAVDSAGNVYVADTNNSEIRKITPAGVVTTLAGGSSTAGSDGEGFGVGFNNPFGIAVDTNGTVYVADTKDDKIRSGTVYAPPVPPTFTLQASPSSVTIDLGRSVAFNAVATGTPAPSYQWTLNGSTAIPGAAITTDPILLITAATVSNNGTYTCTASNSAAPNATTSATLTVQATGDPARLVNLSARAEDLTGGNILIAGLSVGGSGTEPVLIRGVGPTLSGVPFDIANYLPNPVITLFDNNSQPIVSDRGWGNAFTAGSSSVNASPTAATVSLMNQVGAFLIPQGSADSAMEIQVQGPGNYTMELTDANGAAGVGLAEVYDAGSNAAPTRLANISARADVGAGGDILIGGLVVTGGSAETVLLRAVGPGLVNQGLDANSGLLAQPSLAVYQGSTQIYSNTGWGSDPVISSVFSVVGATALETADSAVLLTLPNGAYTVLVSGVGGSSGVGLVEVFEVY